MAAAQTTKHACRGKGPQPQPPAVDLGDRRPWPPVPLPWPIAAAHADKRFPRAGPGRAVVYGRAAIAGRRPLLCCAPGETRFGMLVIPWAPPAFISGCPRYVWRALIINSECVGPAFSDGSGIGSLFWVAHKSKVSLPFRLSDSFGWKVIS